MEIFCIINLAILILLSLIFSSFSVFGVGLIGFIILFIVARSSKQKCFNQLTIVFIISTFLMLILYYGYIAKYGTPYYIGGSDDLRFEQFSSYIISRNYYMPHEILQDLQFQWYSANGFLWILSWIMRFSNLLGGYHTVAYRIMNIYFLLILSVLVFRYFTERYSFTKKQNIGVLYAIALFPNCQYITLHVFRDTLNILLLFAIFYVWDKYFSVKKSLLLTLVITALLTYVLYWMRNPNLMFVVATILVNLFLKDKKLSIRNFRIFLVLVVVSIALLDSFDVFKEVLQTNESYSNYILTNNDGLSTTIFSMKLFPFGILLRVIYGLNSPLPVAIMQFPDMFDDIDAFFNVIVALGVIAQIYMLPYLFNNTKKIDKIVILFSVFLVAIVATTFTFRHFIMLYPYMVILIFRQFFEASKTQKTHNFMYMTGLLTMFAFIYWGIK